MKVSNTVKAAFVAFQDSRLLIKTIWFASFCLLAPVTSAEDYQFELELGLGPESTAGVTSNDTYSAGFKYLFDLGGKHKPKYDILGEHEFLAKKSYVKVGYRDEDISFKDVSRSRNQFRSLDSFLHEPASEQIARARADGLSQAEVAIADEDYSAAAAALAGPGPGIPGLTGEQVEAALIDLAAPKFLAAEVLPASFEVVRDSSKFKLETLDLDALFVIQEKYIVEVGYQRVSAPGYERSYEVTSDETLTLARLGIIDGALAFSEFDSINNFDLSEPVFNITPDLIISSDVDLVASDKIEIDQDIISVGAGVYLNDASAVTFNYKRSETDAEISGYGGDYDQYELRYKLAMRIPDLNGITVLDFAAAHREEQSGGNLNRVSLDADYYLNKRLSLGAAFEMMVSNEAEDVTGYTVDAQYFITDNVAINAGFTLETVIGEQSDDPDIPNTEIYSLSIKGRI